MTRSVLALSIAAALGGSCFAGDAMAQEIQGPPVSPAVFSSAPALGITDDGYDGTLGSMACDTIDASAIPAGATVDDIEIQTGINHSWIGDLVIKLQSPDGSVLGLLSRPGFAEPADDGTGCCGDSSDLVSTSPINFFDSAPNDAELMGSTIGGAEFVCLTDGLCDYFPNPDSVATPPANFAGFAGEAASGNWMLCIGDSEGGDVGSFETWEVTIAYTVPASALSLSVASINFGAQGIGSPSAPSTVTIENTGGVNLDIGVLNLIGANPGDFGISADSCSGVSVAPAATCSFDVTATPSAAGVRSASVDIPSNAPSSPDSLPLEVTGVVGALSITPASVNFGAGAVGDTTAATTVTVENTGGADVDVGTLAISGANAGDFGLSADGCSGATLTPAATCSFDVTATPSAVGVRNAAVDIPSDAPSSPDSLPMEVTGVMGALAITPGSVNLGSIDVGDTTAATTVTVENTGGADVVVGALAISGANAGDFALSADGCTGATLTPAATCTFDVAMTPSAAGARSAQVDIPSDAPSSPDSVALAGSGIALAPAFSVPVNSAWATIVLAGMLGLFGWLGLRRTASPVGRRKR